MRMLSVENITKIYGERIAVNDISFTVEAGEIVGFLGPNGAGKTTSMRIITGFIPPTSGTVVVAGHDVRTESLEVRRHIGYLPESAPLYTEMRVEEYLEFRAKLKDVPRRQRRKRIEEAMSRTRITERRRQIIGTLSKGFRQRVGLSDALLGDVRLLILDEPTIGLDPNQIREVRSLIRELDEERKLAILISTHILPEVEQICERVLIIRDGRLVVQDTTENLLRRSRVSGLVRVVIAGGSEDDVREAMATVPGVLVAYGEDDRQVTSPHAARGVGEIALRLETEEDVDVRDAVFAKVVERGWRLRELAAEQLTLEEVFHDLTRSRSAPVGAGL